MFENQEIIFFGVLLIIPIFGLLNTSSGEPVAIDPKLTIEKVYTGNFEPSTMAFLGLDDILVLDRDNGKVLRVQNGIEEKTILDVNVATDGYRGLLGIAVSAEHKRPSNVFLYYTESRNKDGEDDSENSVPPLGNRIYKYDLVDNRLLNPTLLLDLPALPGPRHAGGVLAIGPDDNLYATVGDLDGTFKNQFETMAQNYKTGKPADGRSGILVLSKNGEPLSQGILGNSVPLKYYYAYGIRNSFGIDWDPLTSNLWDSENGPTFGDELNLVFPGFNSGWASIQGYWKPNLENKGQEISEPTNLVDFNGNGRYSSPEFVWLLPAAPSAIKFLDSDLYGTQYENDLLVGDANNGYIYDFNLDEDRMKFDLSGRIEDNIADNTEELDQLIFAKGFGKVADIKIGPDGFIYVLSTESDTANIYRIQP